MKDMTMTGQLKVNLLILLQRSGEYSAEMQKQLLLTEVVVHSTVYDIAMTMMVVKKDALAQLEKAGIGEDTPLYQAVQKDYLLAKAFAELAQQQK